MDKDGFPPYLLWFGLTIWIVGLQPVQIKGSEALCDATMRLMLTWLQRNLLPDAVIRRLIRMFIASRLRYSYQPLCQLQLSQLLHFVHSLKQVPITLRTGPHPEHYPYALPTSFFKLILGKNLKLSCCYFADERSSLEDAEKAMLELYCERAQIKDGQSILDIGCGWGSLCLYIAQKHNNCRVTGITDSGSQKAYIDELCRDLELQNLEIIVADVCTFEMDASYDRLISVETFEHIKNYKDLLKKISGWMKPDSLLFVHHICHKAFAYHFEDVNEGGWLTKYDWLCRDVLVGSTMLSANLLLYFQDDVSVVNHWLVNGKHNAQTG
ncbi:hypothetical protein FEM48_Zijuj06G0055700 [Ziziphus jujuba var. spinosa]|uniref:(S)-coclaurine N-methyltransferase-like n=1 Tax=Ziziphus jujuba var. spinosa TaxID=714518 RepID=A0A978V7G4_ZIZJJ|nr:hypothetical protein FEM48_Zijuj06G0055700 [Ziziphus jujuba var. spinosa]